MLPLIHHTNLYNHQQQALELAQEIYYITRYASLNNITIEQKFFEPSKIELHFENLKDKRTIAPSNFVRTLDNDLANLSPLVHIENSFKNELPEKLKRLRKLSDIIKYDQSPKLIDDTKFQENLNKFIDSADSLLPDSKEHKDFKNIAYALGYIKSLSEANDLPINLDTIIDKYEFRRKDQSPTTALQDEFLKGKEKATEDIVNLGTVGALEIAETLIKPYYRYIQNGGFYKFYKEVIDVNQKIKKSLQSLRNKIQIDADATKTKTFKEIRNAGPEVDWEKIKEELRSAEPVSHDSGQRDHDAPLSKPNSSYVDTSLESEIKSEPKVNWLKTAELFSKENTESETTTQTTSETSKKDETLNNKSQKEDKDFLLGLITTALQTISLGLINVNEKTPPNSTITKKRDNDFIEYIQKISRNLL